MLDLLGLIRTGAFVELAFAMTRVADGLFTPTEKETAILNTELKELAALASGLQPLRNA